MALREKLNSLAATASSRANLAIENGKLNLKIGNEEKKIADFTMSLGVLVLDQLDAGTEFEDEIMALYSSIQAARENILKARAAIDANRQAAEAPAEPMDAEVVPADTCPHCGVDLKPDAKFCANCGADLSQPAEPAEPERCGSCGAELEPNANFCNQCGKKV